MKNLQTLNIDLLESIENTISSLNDQQYTESMEVLSNATIGQHIRHMLEFYQAIDVAHKTGEIDYDDRKRSLKMESSIEFAKESIEVIKKNIVTYTEDKQIAMSGNYSLDSEKSSTISTTLSRELAFSMEHTIHHLAIIKNALVIQGVKLEENFGVAPSTIRFKNNICAQ